MILNKDHKISLQKKREKLIEEVKKQNRIDSIKDLLLDLDCQGVKYDIALGTESSEWLEVNVPFTSWGRVNWDKVKVKNKIIYRCSYDENMSNLFAVLIKSAGLDLHDKVSVLWSNADKPALDLLLTDLVSNIDNILDEDFDTWIISKKFGWCIESYHYRTIGFAKL